MPAKKGEQMATIETRKSRGKTVYHVKIRKKGVPALSATFPSKTLANDWAQKVETQIKENTYFPTLQAQRHTLNELLDFIHKNCATNQIHNKQPY